MNQIQCEMEQSHRYDFDFLPDSAVQECGDNLLLVAPSLENVIKVEAMIRIDSKYCKAFDKNARPVGGYEGSTAYWMVRLKEYLESHKNLNKDCKEYVDIIANVVNAVDRDNSTHLNSDGGRNIIKERILGLNKDDFLKPLKKRTFDLYEKIAKRTSQNKGARTNPSFASKFCHYACMFLFEGEREQDNFSICDDILRKIIPQYASYYDIDFKKKMSYREYSEIIDKILDKSGNKISRNGFDHLLWYYYKGRLEKKIPNTIIVY